MTIYLKDLSYNDFLSYANERMNKSYVLNNRLYPHLNDNRFKLAYEWYVNHNLKCSGSNYKVTCTGREFSYFSSPETQVNERMVFELYHTVFCQCEWASRGLNDFYRTTVEQEFSKQFVKSLSAA
jgi:hypothetical protein